MHKMGCFDINNLWIGGFHYFCAYFFICHLCCFFASHFYDHCGYRLLVDLLLFGAFALQDLRFEAVIV